MAGGRISCTGWRNWEGNALFSMCEKVLGDLLWHGRTQGEYSGRRLGWERQAFHILGGENYEGNVFLCGRGKLERGL